MDDRHRDVALFRYSLIREAADPALTKTQRGALVRALAARDHTGPSGERVRVSRNTLDRWIRNWRAGGGVGPGSQTQTRGTRAHRRPGESGDRRVRRMGAVGAMVGSACTKGTTP